MLLQYQSSQKRLLNSLRNATYEWRHNDTILNDTQNNRLVIPQTSDTDAGTYSVKIVSFGFSNATNPVCAASVLELLRSYAIFRETEFYVYISNSKT